MKPAELIDRYYELIKQKNTLLDEIETAKQLVIDQLDSLGVKSLRTAHATATKAVRKSYNVDERAFLDWAKRQPDFEADTFYVSKIDKDKLVDWSIKHLKETGEVVPYITVSESEYLSVRNAEKTGQNG